jgi:hypothetical protein
MSGRSDRTNPSTRPGPLLPRARAWGVFGIALGLAVAAELLLGARGRFGVDGWFGFAAWYGFLSCVVLVALARLVGLVVKRPERYYEDRDV